MIETQDLKVGHETSYTPMRFEGVFDITMLQLVVAYEYMYGVPY